MIGSPGALPQSLNQFGKIFPDEKSCAAYLFNQRWPGGFVCPGPGCQSSRVAWLRSRAYTYECLACGRQTSITAGTVMHRSKLPLTVWFCAAHLIATQPEDVPPRLLKALLGIRHESAWLLKQKLDGSIAAALLEGRVEVGHAEIPLPTDHSYSDAPRYRQIIVATALEEISRHIRLAAIPDGSAASIEAFVQANVKRGATLLSNGDEPYLGLPHYHHAPREAGEPLPRSRLLSVVRDWLGKDQGLGFKNVDIRLGELVVYQNNLRPKRRVSFDTLLGLVAHHEPRSYWDIIGRDNPRKGIPTTRRRPRRRKTATGMREDGSDPETKLER